MKSEQPIHVWMPNVRGNSGSDVFIERLAEGLRDRGVTVTVDWFDRPFEFVPELLALRRAPADVNVIHANGLNAFAFRRHGLPLVVSEHHYVLDPGYRQFKTRVQHLYQLTITGRSSKRSFAAASMLVSPSRFTRRVLMAVAPTTPQATIPLWVDTERFSPAADSQRRPGPLRVLFVGNSSFRKGADVIAPLAERLGHGFEFLCTGGLRGGADESAAASVRHLGRLSVDELVAAYRDCDAVLVPSRYEGFGYAALEAMACAKPVVAFACGAVDEIVDDGVTGFMLPIGDIEGTAAAIRALADDSSRAAAMGRAGRARALAVFSESSGIQAYLDLYRQLLQGTSRGSVA
ncbi:glycosyltransferase family 4 protein [Luteibacter sp. 22Crub2.1]|uniref:glycosyltransferase family 4 protein n=1 Tax=Luteibacter sp. 22Crub2.1 TaxID=1283288 RepID=UPI0009D4F48C|nr:glycosyltransferase family 4 protein [Luteibacter sp. 22Crub2.1]SKB42738.1 Glycosyltransferase involved in cell wall bisynthesis [Luteibacter sp. 22Crub2.1]